MHYVPQEQSVTLPPELLQPSGDFPFCQPVLPKEELFALITKHLPTYERATALAESFLGNVGWVPRPIQREQIMEDLIPLLYKGHRTGESETQSDGDEKYDGKHRLHNFALILAVFACGAAVDLTQEPNNAEGLLYNRLSIAALSSHSIINAGVSLETVQAIILIAQYDFFSCMSPSLEKSWKLLSIGLILAASVSCPSTLRKFMD